MYNKWQSRRWLVALWSMLAASAIIGSGIIQGDIPGGMGAALALLVGVAGGYIAADSMTKPGGGA
jgi:hypothetical protein